MNASADDSQDDLMVAILTISRLMLPLTDEGAEKCERVLRAAHYDESSPFWTDAAYRLTSMRRAIWIVRKVREDQIGPRCVGGYLVLGASRPTIASQPADSAAGVA